jgi:hypothetical protein
MASLGRKMLLRAWLLASILLVILMQFRLVALHRPSSGQKTATWTLRVTTDPRTQATTAAIQFGASQAEEFRGKSRASKNQDATADSMRHGQLRAIVQMTRPVSTKPRHQFLTGQTATWKSISTSSTPIGAFAQGSLAPGNFHNDLATKHQHIQGERLTNNNSSHAATIVSSDMQAGLSDSRSVVGVGSRSRSVIAPVLEASARVRNEPEYRRKLEQAASMPINIAVMTGLFWQLPSTHTEGCHVDGIPLDCYIQMGGSEVSSVTLWCLAACKHTVCFTAGCGDQDLLKRGFFVHLSHDVR